MMYRIYRTSLTHHGIKGMTWGKRNGPPYPLGYSDHSVKEKRMMTKAQKEKAKRENPSKSDSLSADKKKLMKIAAITAGAGLAVIGGYALYKSGALNKLIKSGKSFTNKVGVFGSELPNAKISNKETTKHEFNDIASRLKRTVADSSKVGISFQEVAELDYVKNINDVEGHVNCPSGSLAYICNRLFGGNFKAIPDSQITEKKQNFKYIKSFFKDGTIKEIDPSYRLPAGRDGCLFNQKFIDMIPNGSTGMLAFNFTGTGHWVNYEKTEKGEFTLICTQNRRIVPDRLITKLVEKFPSTYKYCYSILDFTNAEFSEDGLRRLPEILR